MFFPRRKLNFGRGFIETNARIEELLKRKDRVVVSIGGPARAGKTRFAKKLGHSTLHLDNYYRNIEEVEQRGLTFYDPASIDLARATEDVRKWLQGKAIRVPTYDMKSHKRIGFTTIEPGRVLVIEGLFALAQEFESVADLKIYVHARKRKRVSRRHKAGEAMGRRERTLREIRKRLKITEPKQKEHIMSRRESADIIIKS